MFFFKDKSFASRKISETIDIASVVVTTDAFELFLAYVFT